MTEIGYRVVEALKWWPADRACSRGSILCLLTLRGHRGLNAWRAGIGNYQYSWFGACFSPMNIVDRFCDGLSLMND
jgi:hypothetical protein